MDVDSTSTEIGKLLQWLRKNLLLTQYQLASFTELDYRHYQNIENGKVELKVETMKRICASFGIGLSTFFYLLDRKPWIVDATAGNSGAGDLYLYRMILEQAKFRLQSTVREHISEWGRAIAEGDRDTLKDCLKPSMEVDSEFRILWKNNSATDFLTQGDKDLAQLICPSAVPMLQAAAREFWQSKANSLYVEVPLRAGSPHANKPVAIIGLKPMKTRPEQTLFVSIVEIDRHESGAGNDEHVSLRDANRIFM